MSEASLQNKPGEASEGEDDDMAFGDLGNGLLRRHSDICELEGFSVHTGRPRRCSARKSFSPFMLPNKREEYDAAVFRCSRCNSLNDMSVKKNGINGFSSCSRQNSSESNSEVSNEELRQHLQEAVEEVEILRVELEASQRQLEGKEQALKILQSMAVLDKATSHTKDMFKKTEQQKRALEKTLSTGFQAFLHKNENQKLTSVADQLSEYPEGVLSSIETEINVLQWEIKIIQERFKNIEESWAEKFDRIDCENAALKETLKLKIDEVKTLKSENEILAQQHLEILAMLDIKQQKIVQENMLLNKGGITEITGLELAVLGACTCSGPEGEPCSCAKMSAATRKQLLQLKQETEFLKKSKDEAYIMADAFRIAFEQQLMRRKDQALRLAQMNKICKKETKRVNWKSLKDDGVLMLQGNRKGLGQKLMGMLTSGTDSKKIEELDNPPEIIRMLIDLLNDKEEALAHQRKVSYMLARALEEKENSLQQNKENKLSEEELDLKINPCGKDPEAQESVVPMCSCCQPHSAENSSCSISSTCTIQDSAETTQRSCSLISDTVFCRESDVHEAKETADTN